MLRLNEDFINPGMCHVRSSDGWSTMFSSSVCIWGGEVWMGMMVATWVMGYPSWGGSEGHTSWRICLVACGVGKVITVLERCSMAGLYEFKQMFTNFFWWSAYTRSLRNRKAPNRLPAKILKACKALASWSFLGQSVWTNYFFPL